MRRNTAVPLACIGEVPSGLLQNRGVNLYIILRQMTPANTTKKKPTISTCNQIAHNNEDLNPQTLNLAPEKTKQIALIRFKIKITFCFVGFIVFCGTKQGITSRKITQRCRLFQRGIRPETWDQPQCVDPRRWWPLSSVEMWERERKREKERERKGLEHKS